MICLWVFKMGIYGVVLSDIVFGLFMNILNFYSLSKYLRLRIDIVKTFVLPGGAALIMGVAAWGVYQLLFGATKKNTVAAAEKISAAAVPNSGNPTSRPKNTAPQIARKVKRGDCRGGTNELSFWKPRGGVSACSACWTWKRTLTRC